LSPLTRPLTAADVEHVRWALYEALAWNPARKLPPPGWTLEHPEAKRYHREWGRDGDLGVVALRDEEVVGVAYCRLFTDDDHGHGYLDDATPEVAVAVREDERGRGLGARLLTELATLAAENGVRQLSLSVDPANPALRLYERLGYREWSRDEDGVRMVLELDAAAT
jgi:[ribosomal protein S18]-alanine N-acetyltransferase